MSEGGSALSDILNPGRPLTWEEWDAGQFLSGPYAGQSIPMGHSFSVAANGTVMNMEYRGTGGTGGGGQTFDGGESVQGGIGTTGENATPPPTTPNPLSGPSANGLPWYPNTYGLGPGMYASLQDQIAANQARQQRDPFAANFERFNFSHGGDWDAKNTFGPAWGKESNYSAYPLPKQYLPVPVNPPGSAPPPATGTAGLLGGGSTPGSGATNLNRNAGGFPAMRGNQTPIAEMDAMRRRPGTGLLGAQMIGSPADATVSEGLLGTGGRVSKALPATNSVVGGSNAGMYPMAPKTGADAFRFANPATDAATNYNALASLSPQIAAQYLNTAGQAARPQLYDQAQGGMAQTLLNSGSAASGGLQGSSLMSTFAQIPGFAGSPLAAALAKMPGGFNTYLSPADAAKLGLTPNTFGGALPNSNFYTVPLAK